MGQEKKDEKKKRPQDLMAEALKVPVKEEKKAA